jgi:hypothetical protein
MALAAILALALCLATPLASAGDAGDIDVNELPLDKVSSWIKKSARYRDDATGENWVTLTETGPLPGERPGDGGRAELYVWRHHWTGPGVAVTSDESWEETWRITDRIRDCRQNITLSFIPGAFAVTDLDGNGLAEIWTMYIKDCRGEAGPPMMRIVMYEGKKRYDMHGTRKTGIAEIDALPKDKNIRDSSLRVGDYSYDSAFVDGPKAFLAHARRLWAEHVNP